MPEAIAALPPVPTRGAQTQGQFSLRAETFLAALDPWATQANALGVEVSSNALAVSLAAAAADAAADRAEAAAAFRVSIAAATWAGGLQAISGTFAGQSAAVFGDGGTHTDPVVGGTVDNEGIYAWSTSPAGWRRMSDLSGGAVAWADITSKPTTFAPSAHTHAQSDITGLTDALTARVLTADLPELVRDTIAAALVGGDGVTITPNDGTDTILIEVEGGAGTVPAAGIAVSTGSAWAASLTVPTGALVGTTASQTLTNKTLGSGTSITGGIASALTLQAGVVVDDTGTISATSPGFRGTPQITGTTRTLALTDAGKMIHVSGTITIPANSSVPFPIGTTILLSNSASGTSAINITSDTLRLAGTTSTGNRTLDDYGLATLVKVGATEWKISGDVS